MSLRFKCLLISLNLLFAGFSASAQTGLCPSNLNFEGGDFAGWICRAGTVFDNPLPLSPPIPGRHTIIDSMAGGIDPFGFFPQSCPNGSRYSVQLGNQINGSQSESIEYTYTIPSTLSTFSMIFHYAVVLESPGHVPANQPRFQARIIDVSTGLPIACVDFDFIPQTTPGGFQTSPIPGNLGSVVLYKDWTPISINLNAYIGGTIKLEFITKDCSQSGHAGYAYVDVNTNCNGVISGNFICPGDTSLTLTAPFGFQNYIWYSDQTYSTIIATTQTLYLNPLPSVGTVFPVRVIPYPGFGCEDTLFATIDVGTPPAADAGPDQISCQMLPVQIGAPPNPSYTYEWTPVGQVSNPNISNPMAWSGGSPTLFIVKATDILNGCTAYDSTNVVPFFVDTTLTITGKADYCPDEPSKAVLSVSNSINAVQWYDASGPIAGANALTYFPTASGTYWASLSEGGCFDSTRSVDILIYPFPVASFTPDSDTGCVTRNSFLFTNASTISDGSPLSYIWTLPDGSTQTTTDATASFSTVGTYTIKLLATSPPGCKDSTSRDVIVMPNGIADFTWDSICTNRPSLFRNLSIENNSPQVNYIWDFNNGGPLVTVKDPPIQSFTQQGWTPISLKLIALGCENDTQTVVKRVLVNFGARGVRYPDVTIPLGSSKWVHVRDSIGDIYSWRPTAQLSSYWTNYTEIFATNNDILYFIDIIDEHTCVTTDTLQMWIFRDPGYYLPTAFTPNDDGLNDIARPYLIGMKSLKSFSVFDRWGSRVYYTTREGDGWDGKYKGEKVNSGVYVWMLTFMDGNNNEVTAKGTITVIR